MSKFTIAAVVAGLFMLTVPPSAAQQRAATPTRIVSLVPATTEMLFAMGAGGRVVGVGNYDRFPPEVSRLPRVGGLVDPDTERVILFGSTARGTVGSTSDLDLLVVRRDNRPPAARMDEMYCRARSRIALDLLVYTPEELESARATSSFLREALRNARVKASSDP